MSTKSRIEKLSMPNVANRKVLGNQKRTHNNMDEPQRHNDTKRNQTQKEYTLYDFIYMKYKNGQNLPILKNLISD